MKEPYFCGLFRNNSRLLEGSYIQIIRKKGESCIQIDPQISPQKKVKLYGTGANLSDPQKKKRVLILASVNLALVAFHVPNLKCGSIGRHHNFLNRKEKMKRKKEKM